MEDSPVHIKVEPKFSHLSDDYNSSIEHIPAQSHLSPVYTGISDDPPCLDPPVTSSASIHGYIIPKLVELDNIHLNQSNCIQSSAETEYKSSSHEIHLSKGVFTPKPSYPTSILSSEQLPSTNSIQSSGINNADLIVADIIDGSHKSSSIAKPSEALFVRTLISRCKRIAPLWFRGVSSMRERNREENRRMACNSAQSQNDWSLIGSKIAVSEISICF